MCLLYLSVPEEKRINGLLLCSILCIFVRFISVMINAMKNLLKILLSLTKMLIDDATKIIIKVESIETISDSCHSFSTQNVVSIGNCVSENFIIDSFIKCKTLTFFIIKYLNFLFRKKCILQQLFLVTKHIN